MSHLYRRLATVALAFYTLPIIWIVCAASPVSPAWGSDPATAQFRIIDGATGQVTPAHTW